MTTIYHFPKFELQYTKETGNVKTIFEDGSISDVSPNNEDARHAKILGITSEQHKLAHELAHALIATARCEDYCRIVHSQALNLPMPSDANEIEKMVFALSYFAFDTAMEYPDWWSALGEIQKFVNPYIIKKLLTNLLQERETSLVKITYK